MDTHVQPLAKFFFYDIPSIFLLLFQINVQISLHCETTFPREIIYIHRSPYALFSRVRRKFSLLHQYTSKHLINLPDTFRRSIGDVIRIVKRQSTESYLRVTKRNVKRRDRFPAYQRGGAEHRGGDVIGDVNRGRRRVWLSRPMANDQWENAARLYLGPRVHDILSLASFPCQTSDRVSDRVPQPSQDQGYRACMCVRAYVRESKPVSTTFGSLSLVTGSSGFGHKVADPLEAWIGLWASN